jgi:arylsulfatase A-like enzyme
MKLLARVVARKLVQGEKVAWRKEWFYEHHYAHGGKIPELEGVRAEQLKCVRYTSATPTVEELYDLRRDPLERKDLSGEPAYTKSLVQMRRRWMRLRDELR